MHESDRGIYLFALASEDRPHSRNEAVLPLRRRRAGKRRRSVRPALKRRAFTPRHHREIGCGHGAALPDPTDRSSSPCRTPSVHPRCLPGALSGRAVFAALAVPGKGVNSSIRVARGIRRRPSSVQIASPVGSATSTGIWVSETVEAEGFEPTTSCKGVILPEQQDDCRDEAIEECRQRQPDPKHTLPTPRPHGRERVYI